MARMAITSRTNGRWRVRPLGQRRQHISAGTADDEQQFESSSDNRDPTGLPIQRDGDRGPGVSGSIQGLIRARSVHNESDGEERRWEC